MNWFINFCLILIAVISTEVVWCKNRNHKVKHSDENDGKIVGGNETTINEYPYQAYLLLYNGQYYYQCGGSIISKKYILTAAHCLSGMQKIYVRIGSTNKNSGGTQYETTSFRSHPKYNSRTSDYDAGLVKISQGMNLDGTNAKAITMVDAGYDPPEGEDVILTGWGATSQNGQTSTTLMAVQVPVVPLARCRELLGNGITTRMLCAGLEEGGKDTCQGDSGGPAVVNSTNRLTGITSFGVGCAQPKAPGVYAFVGNQEIRLFIKTYARV